MSVSCTVACSPDACWSEHSFRTQSGSRRRSAQEPSVALAAPRMKAETRLIAHLFTPSCPRSSRSLCSVLCPVRRVSSSRAAGPWLMLTPLLEPLVLFSLLVPSRISAQERLSQPPDPRQPLRLTVPAFRRHPGFPFPFAWESVSHVFFFLLLWAPSGQESVWFCSLFLVSRAWQVICSQ